MILDVIDALPEEAVIVVMSDHGTGLGEMVDGFRNLIALRSPGHPNLLPDDATAITVIPRILNAYLDAGIPLPSDDRYSSLPGTRLELTPWP